MFNTNKQVKDDICRSRFALFINNIKRDIKGDGTIIENPVESP